MLIQKVRIILSNKEIDFRIIIDTVKIVFRHEGISNGESATMTEFMGNNLSSEVIENE